MAPSHSFRGGPGNSRKAPPHIRNGLGGKVTTSQSGKRHRKILRDTIQGITNPAIRRLARRGGVKRISKSFYNDARTALREYLRDVLRHCNDLVEYRKAKTVTVHDVIFALNKLGRPVYGFEYPLEKTKKSK